MKKLKIKKKCHQYFHILHYLKFKVRVSDFFNGNSQILHSGFLKKLDFSSVLIFFLWKRACEFYKHSFVA